MLATRITREPIKITAEQLTVYPPSAPLRVLSGDTSLDFQTVPKSHAISGTKLKMGVRAGLSPRYK
ncbi:MAG: hypothetical protein C5S49_06935 [Candidatus Methanogaster sp.]|nr:MAG: hypothetical protein C5S49_06935 [ANME-2 cluster archaeon]